MTVEGELPLERMRVLIAGCGYVGTKLGTLLAEQGHEVWGLRRDPSDLPPSIRPIAADLLDPDLDKKLPAVDRVVYAASADSSSPEGYQVAYREGVENLLSALQAGEERIQRFLFISSTAVYGEAGGAWVDEVTPPAPASFRGEIVLSGEEAVLEATRRAHPFQGVILRLGGIYGPGRTRLLERVRSGEARCKEGVVEWSNRIHRDDAAGAALHLLQHEAPASHYIGVDQEPVPICEVYRHVAQLLGVPEPGGGAQVRHDLPADLTASQQSGKRCSNRRLLDSGYSFLFPTFREGYREMVRSGPSSATHDPS